MTKKPAKTPARAAGKADPIVALLQQAAAKLDQLDFGSALAMYQQALQKAPGNAAALMGLAMTLNRSGQPAQALPLLDRLWKAAAAVKVAQGKTFQTAVLAQLGLAQQQLGRAAEALKAFEQAHALTPTAELRQRIDQLGAALRSTDPLQQLLLSARQSTLAGQVDQALKVYAAALQLNADSVEALHGLAMLHRQRTAFDLALPLLQKAVILAPDRADLFNDLGMLFQDRGDLNKAVSFHKRALRVDAKFVPALVNLGVAYKRLGDTAQAITAYRQALDIAPNFAQAHNNLGNLLRITGDLNGALQHLERALALKPDYKDAQVNLAALKQQMAQRAAVQKPAKSAKAGKVPASKTTAKAAGKGVQTAKKAAAKTVKPTKAAAPKAPAKAGKTAEVVKAVKTVKTVKTVKSAVPAQAQKTAEKKPTAQSKPASARARRR